ncbi:MAG: oxidoreductase [Coriobacteriia bacterium]|nr:oxidoreductase [Coriobacteriia bacterium]
MSKQGLLIDYEYCSGCHSCEVACRKELGLSVGEWGIKIATIGPWQHDDESWEWNHIPIPTKLCDLCADRVAQGKKPACVHHCLAFCMEYGTVEELSKKMEEKGTKVFMVLP